MASLFGMRFGRGDAHDIEQDTFFSQLNFEPSLSDKAHVIAHKGVPLLHSQ
jgi:hypothetical protein